MILVPCPLVPMAPPAFLGIAPPRPLRVLSLDFESFEDIYADNLTAIGTADGWDFVDIDDLERGAPLIQRASRLVVTGR